MANQTFLSHSHLPVLKLPFISDFSSSPLSSIFVYFPTCLKKGSYVAQACFATCVGVESVLEFLMFLPSPPKPWEYLHGPLKLTVYRQCTSTGSRNSIYLVNAFPLSDCQVVVGVSQSLEIIAFGFLGPSRVQPFA